MLSYIRSIRGAFKTATGMGLAICAELYSGSTIFRSLGATVIWLCPIYASPLIDNGYDISDYYAIHPGAWHNGRF